MQELTRQRNPRDGKAVVILSVALVAVAAMCGYLFTQIDAMREEVATLNAGLEQQVSDVRENHAAFTGK